jgi:hypothetical protein
MTVPIEGADRNKKRGQFHLPLVNVWQPLRAPQSGENHRKEVLWQVEKHLRKVGKMGRVLRPWPRKWTEPIWIKPADRKVHECLALVRMRKQFESPNEC